MRFTQILIIIAIILGLIWYFAPDNFNAGKEWTFNMAHNLWDKLNNKQSTTEKITETQITNTSTANPASVFCIEHNGTSKMITNASGMTGICEFPSGKYCEEWAYMQARCIP